MSSDGFRGEADRVRGFREALRSLDADLRVVTVAGGRGLSAETRARVSEALERTRDVVAVYSAGGGNAAILDALDAEGRRVDAFIAHDLDEENRALLSAGRIDVVLHHRLREDARAACLLLMRASRRAPSELDVRPSELGVATRFNAPSVD